MDSSINEVVQSDINFCDSVLTHYKDGSFLSEYELLERFYGDYEVIKAKYTDVIYGIAEGYKQVFHSEYDMECIDDSVFLFDLRVLKEKLSLFLSMGCQSTNTGQSISIQNINNNTIHTEVQNIQEIINKNKNMSSEEQADITRKIEEIKKIIDSKDSKEKKFKKVNEIFQWIANKSIDIAIAVIPLFIKIT